MGVRGRKLSKEHKDAIREGRRRHYDIAGRAWEREALGRLAKIEKYLIELNTRLRRKGK